MNLIKFVLLYLPEIAGIIALFVSILTLLEINKKQKFCKNDIFLILGTLTCAPLITLLAMYGITATWIEYSNQHRNYSYQNGIWTPFQKRILQTPFSFDGYRLSEDDMKNSFEWPLSGQAGLRIHFKIQDESLPLILGHIGPHWYKSFHDQFFNLIINPKISELIYAMSKKDIIDPQKRLRIFQERLAPFGVTVEQIDFIYLYTATSSSVDD